MPYYCKECTQAIMAGPTKKPGQPQVGHCDCPNSAWIITKEGIRKTTIKVVALDPTPKAPGHRANAVYENDDDAAEWEDEPRS